jgi:hypothetical protein
MASAFAFPALQIFLVLLRRNGATRVAAEYHEGGTERRASGKHNRQGQSSVHRHVEFPR